MELSACLMLESRDAREDGLKGLEVSISSLSPIHHWVFFLLTKHVSWAARIAEELSVLFQGVSQPDQQLCSTLQTSHLPAGKGL